MASFENSVAVPRTSDYAPRPVDFSILGNLYNTYQQQQLTDQQKQENALVIARQRAALEQEQAMRTLFSGGLPIDKTTGQLDYPAIAQAFAKAGRPDMLGSLYPMIQGQEAGRPSPLLSGGPAPSGAPAATPPPARTGDLPPTSRSPQGDQPGSVMEVVAGKVGDADAGRIANSIAAKIGVDPNAGLTLGQKKRAMVLLDRELAANAPATSQNAPQAAPGPLTGPPAAPVAPLSPAARVADAFGAVTPQAAAPPSVGAVTPAAPAAVSGQPPPAPVAPPPVAAQPAPVAASQPAAAGQPAPIFPREPLSPGFSDPQKNIDALEGEARRLAPNRFQAQTVQDLRDKAARIRQTWIEPRKVGPNDAYMLPSGEVVRPAGGSLLSAQAIDDAARVYVDTGKFPPNMGRGVQGEATRNAILERASGMEGELGLDPKDRSQRWQNYATHAAGIRVLETRAANMTLIEEETRTLIPRVRELIAKVPRTNYPDLNRLLLAAREKTGDPNVVQLGVAISSLIPVYARLLKPTGVIGVQDTENAKHILDKAWSANQMNAALDQMEKERTSAKAALEAARKDFGASGATRGAGDVQKWEIGPDGQPRPAK